MPKFAYADSTSKLSQYDTASPSALPFPIHNGESNIHSLAALSGKEFELVWGPSSIEIRKTQGSKTDLPVYTHKFFLSFVRARGVGGTERIYFSGRRSQAVYLYDIYYLKNGVPVLYTTIDPKTLTFPNPCDTSAEIAHYSGDFAFDGADTLYLSSGNVMGPNVGMKVGIYRIKGAGPDSVTGTVERIFLGDGPIQGLCYIAPYLYFLRQTRIYKLDLATLTESLEGDVPVAKAILFPRDLADAGTGFVPTWLWKVLAALIKLLTKTAEILQKIAGSMAASPHPPRG
jgi:hypothetical protein